MHDPLVEAFQIPRPWPRAVRRWTATNRWRLAERRQPRPGSARAYPWWKPSSWLFTPVVAGYRLYFPAMVVVWHREPGGQDAGTVCRHWRHLHGKPSRRWKLHVWHWRIQVPALQALRRRLFTRCSWCHGSGSGDDPVNTSLGWGRDRTPWWRGELGLYHRDCSAVAEAHRTCLCHDPLLERRTHGLCLMCGKRRSYGMTRLAIQRTSILACVEPGVRDRAAYQHACAVLDEQQLRAERRAA